MILNGKNREKQLILKDIQEFKKKDSSKLILIFKKVLLAKCTKNV